MEVHNNFSEPYFVGDEPFMLTYGDGVADINIEELIKFHKSHGKSMTMTSFQPDGKFGALNISEDNRINKFTEKPKGDRNWINAGFFVCELKVFDYIIGGDKVMFEKEPLQNLAKERELFTYKYKGFLRPMDSLKDKNDINTL